MASAPDCSSTPCGWCAKCDPVGSALRTSLGSALADMTGFTMRWKRQATPSGRSWWVLGTPERPTSGTGSGSSGGVLPTPKASDADRGGRGDLIQAIRGNPNKHFTMPYPADYPEQWKPLPGETSTEYWERMERQDQATGHLRRRGPALPTPRPCSGLRSRGVNQTELERALLGTPTAALKVRSAAHAAGRAPNPKELLATPTKRDWRSGKASQATHDRNSRPLSEQAYQRGITGTAALLTLVEWMMGFPARWLLDAALAVPVSPPTATRSSPRSPKRSAGQS